ncbi:MAG: thioredoxin family protein [Lentisphaeria bacterium]
MSLTPSTMQELGKQAPDFSLPDTEGNTVKLTDFVNQKVLLVIFMCNHCPYVKHVRDKLLELVRDYQKKDVAVVAINSNDTDNYPEDNQSRMKEEAAKYNYPFPYLYDATQEVAKAYGAACTPDFFVFGPDRKLFYRGQMDGFIQV